MMVCVGVPASTDDTVVAADYLPHAAGRGNDAGGRTGDASAACAFRLQGGQVRGACACHPLTVSWEHRHTCGTCATSRSASGCCRSRSRSRLCTCHCHPRSSCTTRAQARWWRARRDAFPSTAAWARHQAVAACRVAAQRAASARQGSAMLPVQQPTSGGAALARLRVLRNSAPQPRPGLAPRRRCCWPTRLGRTSPCRRHNQHVNMHVRYKVHVCLI